MVRISVTSHVSSLTQVIVYKIPPLKANEGHRAQEWGDLSSPLWKGRIRIIERSKGVSLQFEDANSGKLVNAFSVVTHVNVIVVAVGDRKFDCGPSLKILYLTR